MLKGKKIKNPNATDQPRRLMSEDSSFSFSGTGAMRREHGANYIPKPSHSHPKLREAVNNKLDVISNTVRQLFKLFLAI